MAENKTKPIVKPVADFIGEMPDPQRRADCSALVELMKEATGAEPKMWGESIVGFGDYHYRYESGREGDWFHMGFSPRKQNLTLYFCGALETFAPVLSRLGKYKTGKGCLYVKTLHDIDPDVLKEFLEAVVSETKKMEKS